MSDTRAAAASCVTPGSNFASTVSRAPRCLSTGGSSGDRNGTTISSRLENNQNSGASTPTTR